MNGSPTWERCAKCGNEYRYPFLCRTHMLCTLCHPPELLPREGDEPPSLRA